MTLSRRDLLASILGMPAALAACRRPMPPALRGRIVGGRSDLGHRLRTAQRPALGIAPTEPRVGVVVVGAGPSGLAAAWRMARLGFRDFTVLDLEDAAGGTSRSGRNAVSAYPWGAHYVPSPSAANPMLIELLREVGAVTAVDAQGRPTIAEECLVRDPDERLFLDGAWHEGLFPRDGASEEDLRQWRAFQREIDRWVAWRDSRGRRAFTIPIAAASDDAAVTALDRISMSQWLRDHAITSPRVRWMVDYACRDDYGLRVEHTSAWAGMFYFASRIDSPGAPAAELIAWPEGNGRLSAHMASVAGERVRLGALVTDVSLEPDGVRVTWLDAERGEPHSVHADRAIVAVPKFIARRIVGAWRERPPPGIEQFTYSPWMVANLTLRDRPRTEGAELAWDNVLYESNSLGYVVATHQSLRDHGPTVLTYYLPFTGADVVSERTRLLAMTWRNCADVALGDLVRAHPDLPALIETLDVYRWGHGMVRPVPGFVWGGARANAAIDVGARIFFAHCDLSGVALLEESLYHGVKSAEDALTAAGERIVRWT